MAMIPPQFFCKRTFKINDKKKFQSYILKEKFDLLSILCITNVIITKSLSWEEVI